MNAYVGFRVREIASGREGVVDHYGVDSALIGLGCALAALGAVPGDDE
jgi:hypothetical protein